MGGTIRRVLLVLGAVLALAAAGCGGDAGGGGGGEPLSADELRSQANEICRDFNTRIDEIQAPESIEELEEFARQGREATEETITDLRALTPPEELANDYNEFLDKGDEIVELAGRLEEAAADQDEQEIESLVEEADQLDTEGDEIARRLGLNDCAEG